MFTRGYGACGMLENGGNAYFSTIFPSSNDHQPMDMSFYSYRFSVTSTPFFSPPIGSMYAIYGNMDPINIPPMLAYIPYMDPIWDCQITMNHGLITIKSPFSYGFPMVFLWDCRSYPQWSVASPLLRASRIWRGSQRWTAEDNAAGTAAERLPREVRGMLSRRRPKHRRLGVTWFGVGW